MDSLPFALRIVEPWATGINPHVGLQVCFVTLCPHHLLNLCVTRAERKKDKVCSNFEYDKVFQRLHYLPPTTEHLIVQLGESLHMA